ncbi:unnamed protein product [Caenorhabditis brenneri]
MRKTKLKHKKVTDWFANNRRKIQQKFRNGKIAELPGQMEALEEKENKEREERGEHLKMRDTEESDEEEAGSGEDLKEDGWGQWITPSGSPEHH